MTKQQLVAEFLTAAGIKINGTNPWDIKVLNDRFYGRVLSEGSLGLGESYMDGWWEAESLDQLFARVLSLDLQHSIKLSPQKIWLLKRLGARWLARHISSSLWNLQSKSRAKMVAKEHYDISSNLYMSFLDPYNQYTCGYFKDTTDLNTAQQQKLDLICRKLQLKSTDRVLDIGCGWGGFAKFAAAKYGCQITGISISGEQVIYAREFTKGLPVDIKQMDYRDLTEKYDKILICGMIEHVGYKNYRTIFEIVHNHLKDDGLFLLHTIGSNQSRKNVEEWMNKYIFPNGMIPSATQLAAAYQGLLVMEDWHNFGQYYDPTLMAWFRNFHTAWPRFQQRYGDRFYRMWKYYLLSCAGAFRARNLQLWQIVFSKKGIPGGYNSIR